MASPSVSSSPATSWSVETASEKGGEHDVENIMLLSSTRHACSPLLQENVQEEDLCKVALTCHFALDVLFSMYRMNIGSTEDLGRVVRVIGVWLSLCSKFRMKRRLCWNYEVLRVKKKERRVALGLGTVLCHAA